MPEGCRIACRRLSLISHAMTIPLRHGYRTLPQRRRTIRVDTGGWAEIDEVIQILPYGKDKDAFRHCPPSK